MSDLSTTLNVTKSALNGFGQYRAGQAAAGAARAQQQADEIAATQQFASGQRAALDEHRNAQLLASRALAVAAAGGGAADPSTVRLIADLQNEGAYRAGMALYGGEAKAQQLRTEGRYTAWAGQQKRRAYNISALGSLIDAGGTLYKKYGMSTKAPNPGVH